MASLSKKAEQARVTYEALIDAAQAAFGERGYADTSIDEIVSRADVTKGAFYHHFSGKKDLFLAVFAGVKKELSRAAFITHVEYEPFVETEPWRRPLGRFAEQTNAEMWQQLHERCRRYIELHTDPALRRIVLVDARWVLSWSERQRIEDDHGVTLLRADLRRAMRRGVILPLPLHSLATLLSGTLNEACLMVANAPDQAAALDETMAVVARFLEGLRPADAPVSGPG